MFDRDVAKTRAEEHDPHYVPMNATGKRRRVQPSLKEVAS